MSITVEFYDKFEPIYYEDKKYLGSIKQVIKDVELNTKLNKELYEYDDYEDFQKALLNDNNIKSYLRGDNHYYYVKLTFDDGGTYEGQIDKEGNYEGIGKDVSFSKEGEKCTFIGDFKKDLQDGEGVFTWSDGATYEGECRDYKKCGKGVFTWPNGIKYEGNFYNNQKAQGNGKITWKDGSTYEGIFNNYGKSSTGTLTINSLQQQWNFPMSNIDIDCKPPKKICKIPFTERTHLIKNLPSELGCCGYSCVEETREPEKEFNINY